MKKEGKKYLIREDELKEIIQETLMLEIYNPDDYQGLHTDKYKGPAPNLGDLIRGAGKLGSGALNAVIPDSYKEKVANGDGGAWNDMQRWLLGTIGASKEGTTGADIIPNIKQIGTNFAPDSAPNRDAKQAFNVAAATQWLNNNAYPQYDPRTCGNCGTRVREALNVGGLGAPWGMPGNFAYDYLQILPANGWYEINGVPFEAGDVCVIASCQATLPNGTLENHPYGHIAMCLGKGADGKFKWASDYKQKNIHGLYGEPPLAAVHVFRYRNRV